MASSCSLRRDIKKTMSCVALRLAFVLKFSTPFEDQQLKTLEGLIPVQKPTPWAGGGGKTWALIGLWFFHPNLI